MALTPGRWIAIFVLGVSATIAAVIGIRDAALAQPRAWWRAGLRSRSADVAALSEAIRTLERRDSIVAALRRSPPAAGFTLVMGPRGDAARRATVDSAARAFWRTYGPAVARVPTVLVITSDTQKGFRDVRTWDRWAHLFTPAHTDGRACVIVVPWNNDLAFMRREGIGTRAVLYGQLQLNAGPCVLLARYGLPGRAIRGWLDSLNWFPARAAMRHKPSSLALSLDPPGAPRAGTTAGVISGYGWYGEPRFSVNGAGCLAGKDEMCDRAWEQVAFRPYRLSHLPRGIVPSERWSSWGPLGDVSTHFLVELEAKLGPQRFAKLWTSDAPLERALAEASGKTMGMLAREVMEGDYRKLTNSPWPTLGEWALSLLLIGASLGGLYLISERRQAA
jgi:hypothetical protein